MMFFYQNYLKAVVMAMAIEYDRGLIA